MSPTAAAGGVILNGTMTNAMVAVLHQFMMLVTLQELVRGDKFRGSKRTLVAGIISTTWSLLQEVDNAQHLRVSELMIRAWYLLQDVHCTTNDSARDVPDGSWADRAKAASRLYFWTRA